MSSECLVEESSDDPVWVSEVPLVPPVRVVPVVDVVLLVVGPVVEVVVVVLPGLVLVFAWAGVPCIRNGATKTPIEAMIRAATATQRV